MASRPNFPPNMQRFPSQGGPMRGYPQQPGYPGPPRPGGYVQMPPGQMPRMGMPPPGQMPPHPYSVNNSPSNKGSSSTSSGSGKSSSSKSKEKKSNKNSGSGNNEERDRGNDDVMQHRASLAAAMDRKRGAAGPPPNMNKPPPKKKKKVADRILPQKVRDLVPESQAYMDLLSFERKLDQTIMRKRLDIQEALKRPMKQKRKLRIFISNTFYPAKQESEDGEETVASWELRVEGRLLEDVKGSETSKLPKRKFSSFFKSLVIELDKDLYGPDNHLVEWHRTATTQETDGFQVKRPGDKNVKCTVLLMLDYQPMQFKLDPRLARLLGVHTQTRPIIINALWQYIKTHKLQDPHEREFINCDKYLEQIFETPRMKFAEIPQRLHPLLMPPDPIVINHIITVEGSDAKKTSCYDIDVEVDDTLKQQMNSFMLNTQSQQEITSLDSKIHETVETINQLKTNREFFLGFTKDPQQFLNNWLVSQSRDLKTMTDVTGNPEEERRSDFYDAPWTQEAVSRYFFGKVQQRRVELEQALGIRNT